MRKLISVDEENHQYVLIGMMVFISIVYKEEYNIINVTNPRISLVLFIAVIQLIQTIFRQCCTDLSISEDHFMFSK